MSLQKKLTEAMTRAATEAVQRERARCLYCLDKLIRELEKQLDQKILMEQQRHLSQVKLKIGKNIVMQAKRAIMSGMRPPEPINTLHVKVHDNDEMSTRISELTNLLVDVGFDGAMSMDDVRKQLKMWDSQEDEIDRLNERIQDEAAQ